MVVAIGKKWNDNIQDRNSIEEPAESNGLAGWDNPIWAVSRYTVLELVSFCTTLIEAKASMKERGVVDCTPLGTIDGKVDQLWYVVDTKILRMRNGSVTWYVDGTFISETELPILEMGPARAPNSITAQRY